MNKFYESMFNQKLHSPYEAKLINYTYPILTGARFGPKMEDVINAEGKGFFKGTDFVIKHLKGEYIERTLEDKSKLEEFGEPTPMTADELLNKVFNRSKLQGGQPNITVTSYNPSTTSSIQVSPKQTRKSYTVSSPKQKQRAPSPDPWGTDATISTLPSSPDPWGTGTPISTDPFGPIGPEIFLSETIRNRLENEFTGLNPEFEKLIKGKAEEIVKSRTEKKTIPKADEQTIKEAKYYLEKDKQRKAQRLVKEMQQPHKTVKRAKKLMEELKEIALVKPQTESRAQPIKPPTEAQQEEDIFKRLEEKEKKVPKQEPRESTPILVRKSPIKPSEKVEEKEKKVPKQEPRESTPILVRKSPIKPSEKVEEKPQQQKTELETYLDSRLSLKPTSQNLQTINRNLGGKKVTPLIDQTKKILGDKLGDYFNNADELTQKRIMYLYFKNQLPGLQGPFVKEGSKEKIISEPKQESRSLGASASTLAKTPKPDIEKEKNIPKPDIEKKELEIISEKQHPYQEEKDFILGNIVLYSNKETLEKTNKSLQKYSEDKINNAMEILQSKLGEFFDDKDEFFKKQMVLLYLEGKLKSLEPKPESKSKKNKINYFIDK